MTLKDMPKEETVSLSRRGFLTGSLGAGAAAAAYAPAAQARVDVEHPDEALQPYEEHWGFCDMCYWRCGLKVRTRNGRAFKIDGNKDHPFNRGVVCGKGNAGIAQVFDPDRLKQPLERVGARGENRWRPITWDAALDRIANEFGRIKEQYGPEALVLIGHGTWEKPYHRLMHALGTPNVTSPVFGLCCGPRGRSYLMVAGRNLTGHETYDHENCDYFLMLGRNVTESLHNGETLAWTTRVADGAKSVYVDPRYTITAAKSEEWLPIRPLTDHAFLLAMIHVIIRDELYDKAFVSEYVTGLPELTAKVARYTPQWQASITDIPAETVERITHEMAEKAPRAIVYLPRRGTRTTNDLGLGMAAAIVNSLFGVWDVKGGIFKPQGFAVPEPDLPEFPHSHRERADLAASDRWPITERARGLTNVMWHAMASQTAGGEPGGEPYALKGLLTAGGNGFMHSSNVKMVRQALENMEFYVAADILPNEMNAYADILLPESSYLERYDDLQTGGAREGFVALREKAMEPLYDTKSSWEICTELAPRLGVGDFFPHATIEELLEDRLSRIGSSLAELKEKGMLFKPADDRINFAREMGGRSAFDTPSGKIELISTTLAEHGMADAIDWIEQPQPDLAAGELHLTIGRIGYHTHARTQNNAWLAYFMPENRLWIHPETAAARGIADGDRVRVLNTLDGEERMEDLPAKVTNRIRKDTVFMVHGFGHWDERLSVAKGRGAADANLTSDDVDQFMGTASYGLSMVRIEKIEGGRT